MSSMISIAKAEYKKLVDVWKSNKLKEQFIMHSVHTADDYCTFLRQCTEDPDFEDYKNYIAEEIATYYTSPSEVYREINASIPAVSFY